MADAITQNLSGDAGHLISPSDGNLNEDSNYTGFVQIIGKDIFKVVFWFSSIIAISFLQIPN